MLIQASLGSDEGPKKSIAHELSSLPGFFDWLVTQLKHVQKMAHMKPNFTPGDGCRMQLHRLRSRKSVDQRVLASPGVG